MFKSYYILLFVFLGFSSLPLSVKATSIENITPIMENSVEKYSKFEVGFDVLNSTYTNPYYPFDDKSFKYLSARTGITANVFILAPSKNNWVDAIKVPCFYFQPYNSITLSPEGKPKFVCRYTPELTGLYKYKISVLDGNGVIESPINMFNVISSNKKGFVRVSTRDTRFFEYSDGSPFYHTLVTVNPLRSNTSIKDTISKLSQNGIKFIRYFPNSEDGTINPFGDTVLPSWRFGGWTHTDYQDLEKNKVWSYSPYYYSAQNPYITTGSKYKLSIRALVNGEHVIDVGVHNHPNIEICSSTNTLHKTCSSKKSGWNDYTLEFTATQTGYLDFYVHGLYGNPDAPSPYNQVRPGDIRINEVILQKYETSSGGWGPNLISRGDANTHTYVDQIEALKLDEILKYSEEYGVSHKLTIFHKNDSVLNYYNKDGNLADFFKCGWGYCPNNFYSGENQYVRWLQQAYMRYFLARWGYSTALHSLEYVNESDLYSEAANAGFMYAKYIKDNQPRNILVTNSFWGFWNAGFFTDSTYGKYLDYSDKHWYANRDVHDDEVISTIWQDTVANVRQCYKRFKEYATTELGFEYKKPFVRGETGVAYSGTEPQDSAIGKDLTGTYYHKKLWSHVGLLGYTCDGEWYPRIFDTVSSSEFPTSSNDIYKIYSTYDKYMAGEPVNNGTHVEIGTDLTGNNQITSSNSTIRAFGSKDPVTTRVLVWVDNKNNTWQNANNSTSASSTISISGLPQGSYTQEVWDTRTATYTKTSNALSVSSNGVLTFNVSTSKDIAYKFYNPNVITPTPSITPSPTTTPTPNKYDLNNDTLVDLKDIIILINYIFNTPTTPITSYDVNSDGKIDLKDVIDIISYIFK